MRFKIRKKSGIIRKSSIGVEKKNQVFYDVPDIGVKLLLDDIHQVIIEACSGPDLFNYKIYSYEQG